MLQWKRSPKLTHSRRFVAIVFTLSLEPRRERGRQKNTHRVDVQRVDEHTIVTTNND